MLTHESLPNSGNNGVRDRGSDTNPASADERGFPRKIGTHVDIGAFEFQDFDVALAAAAPPGTVHALVPATFTFTVTNNGPNASRGVTIASNLPTGTSVVSASTSFTVIGNATGNHVTLAVPDLMSGASTTVTMTILPNAPGPLTVTGILSSHDDTNLTNNTAAVTVTVLPRPTPATGFADVTTLVKIARKGRQSQTRLRFVITNISGTPIQGPLGLVVKGLPSGIKLRKAHKLGRSKQQFVLVDAGNDNILDPGESTTVQLIFSRPFSPRRLRLLAGAFA